MIVTSALDRYGLTGIDREGNVVRVDSGSGATLASVPSPAAADHWWDDGDKGVRVGSLALGSTDPAEPAVVDEPVHGRLKVWS